MAVRPPPFAAVLAVVIAAAAGWWLYSGLVGRTVSTDDGISVLAAESVLREGVPRLPSGLVYTRGYLAHTLLAGSLALFGRTDLGLLVPAWLAGVATLALVGTAARAMTGRAWPGVLAAALVGSSGVMAWYAASPRMYGLLAGFSAWTVVAGWRGFVRGEPRQQVLAVGAAALGLQCERGAALVLLGVGVGALLAEPGGPVARVAALWGRLCPPGSRVPRPGLGLALAGFVVSTALALYTPPDGLRPIVVEAGNMPDFFELSFEWERASRHLVAFDALFPFLLASAVAATVGAFAAGPAARYLAGVLWAALAPVVVLTAMIGERILLFCLPAAALLVAVAAAALVHRARTAGAWALVLVALGAGWGVRHQARAEAARDVGSAVVPAGSFLTPDLSREGRPETRRLLRRLRDRLAPGDVVWASNPWTAAVYLPRVDGLVRQRRAGREWLRFDEPRDEYFGILIYDDLAEIDAALGAATGTVWLVIDFKFAVYTSREFETAVRARFEEVDRAPGGVRTLRARPVARDAMPAAPLAAPPAATGP